MDNLEIQVIKNNRKYSRDEREHHINRWHESGQSKSEYSRQNNIPPTTFFSWTRKKQIRSKKEEFVEVKLNNLLQTEENKIELIIGNRILRMREDISPEVIRRLITELERI
jgi:transposase-like protein